MIFKGRCTSRGVARGSAFLWDSAPVLAAALRTLASGTPAFQLERLNTAIGRACVQLDHVERELAWRAAGGINSLRRMGRVTTGQQALTWNRHYG
jgi:hypothetical protein